MSNIPKGGRGKKAPYQTTHVRIPVALKPAIEQMIAEYKDLVVNDILSADEEISHNNYTLYRELPNKLQMIEITEKLLKQKQSARKTVEKLIKFLYGE